MPSLLESLAVRSMMMTDRDTRNKNKGSNNLTSQSPFRNLRQSPWKRGRGMSEKTLTDNVRVLIKPTTIHETDEAGLREARSTSSFQNFKSLSNGSQPSPWRRCNHDENRESKMELHESEINIFKQLCLDKHDENAAIEILLDSAENSIPDLYAASSESTDHGSRTSSRKKTVSVEGKKKFLDRLFFKPQRKVPIQSNFPAEMSNYSKKKTLNGNYPSIASKEPNIPNPPSSIRRTRISVENTFQEKELSARPVKKPSDIHIQKTGPILDDIYEVGDTTSNISSLSGTKASTFASVNFNRHESLGFESIKDIRKCLKEMERQLGQATHKGQRVSRQKVMRALFTVADSLEDDEERSYLKKELKSSTQTKKEEITQQVGNKLPQIDSSDDDKSEVTTSDDEDFTLDSDTLEEESYEDAGKNDSPFNIVSSVGNFFGVDAENQHAVEEVLDDLLWTEFVSSRQQNANEKNFRSNGSRSNPRSSRARKTLLHAKENTDAPNDKDYGSRGRSWWRNHPSKEEDYDTSSSSEDEFKSYLPTSITIKKRNKQPNELENDVHRSISNPHYRVKLVDTESRLGYEMDRKSPR